MSKILTGNHRLLKNLNSSLILNLVRIKAPISGANLAKITGMRPSTIQNILKNLEKKGLVSKSGTGNSTRSGGRRPTLWKICGNFGFVIGIQLEINEIQAVLVDLNSQIIDKQQIIIEKFNSLSDIENQVVSIVRKILQAQGIDENRLLGVGIGVSGLVDISNGAIIKTSLLSPSQQPIYLEKSLKKHFDVPVYIENDANAAALAEKWFGRAENINNIVFTLVVVNRDVFGIGFGLILNNDIYRGANMFAGETESFTLNLKKILRNCCNYKKTTFAVSDQKVDIDDLRIRHLLKALEVNDAIAIQFFREIGKIVAKELVTVINLLDPKLIVVGGEASKAKKYLLDPIRKVIRDRFSQLDDHKFQITESSLSSYSVALGAATIILQKIFQGPMHSKRAALIDI